MQGNCIKEDVTKNNKVKRSKGKRVLLIGDSMIKEIDVSKLSSNKSIDKICMPGAKVGFQSNLKNETSD